MRPNIGHYGRTSRFPKPVTRNAAVMSASGIAEPGALWLKVGGKLPLANAYAHPVAVARKVKLCTAPGVT